MTTQSNYEKYRGKCYEMCVSAIHADPSLNLVRGYYTCPIWNVREQHWWCTNKNGDIIDPTKLQYPSAGTGDYEVYLGWVVCDNCGKEVDEENAKFDSRFTFCSSRCHGKFIGIY